MGILVKVYKNGKLAMVQSNRVAEYLALDGWSDKPEPDSGAKRGRPRKDSPQGGVRKPIPGAKRGGDQE